MLQICGTSLYSNVFIQKICNLFSLGRHLYEFSNHLLLDYGFSFEKPDDDLFCLRDCITPLDSDFENVSDFEDISDFGWKVRLFWGNPPKFM